MEKDKSINQILTDENQVLPEVRSFEYWTKKELESLPMGEWREDIGEFDSLIILPTENLHESGFWCMDFVAVKGNVPFCRLSGSSDVIHIDGIGGYGELKKNLPTVIPPKGWRIDCLKKSKLLRIFSNGKLKAGMPLSSFDIYSID
jgi:hypothetical protein